jgi:RNA polymerase sigma-70 factor (ECF subfamily)
MDEAGLNSRLSRISTIWRLLDDAQASRQTRVRDARTALFERYQGAAYRYLLGAVRNPDAADDLFQEFALKCLQGAFSGADQQRGRFRDYLKSTLYHLIVDHQKRQHRQPRQLDTAVVQPEVAAWDPCQSDRQFAESWRDELLARSWAALAEAERNGGPPYHSVLKFRAENPKSCSVEMASRLTEQLHPAVPFTETGIRKALQRARSQFAQALLDDVVQSLGNPTPEELEQELVEVGLLCYCRSELARRQS